jgi:hypothetical protein
MLTDYSGGLNPAWRGETTGMFWTGAHPASWAEAGIEVLKPLLGNDIGTTIVPIFPFTAFDFFHIFFLDRFQVFLDFFEFIAFWIFFHDVCI